MLSVVNLLTIKLLGFDQTMLKKLLLAFDLWLSAGQPDHCLGCPAHVLVVSGPGLGRTNNRYFERCLQQLMMVMITKCHPELRLNSR